MHKIAQAMTIPFILSAPISNAHDENLHEPSHVDDDAKLSVSQSELSAPVISSSYIFTESLWKGGGSLTFHQTKDGDNSNWLFHLKGYAETEWGAKTPQTEGVDIASHELSIYAKYRLKSQNGDREERASIIASHQFFVTQQLALNTGVAFEKNTPQGYSNVVPIVGIGFEPEMQASPSNKKLILAIGGEYSSDDDQFSARGDILYGINLSKLFRITVGGTGSVPLDDGQASDMEINGKLTMPLGSNVEASFGMRRDANGGDTETVTYFEIGLRDACFINCP